MDSDAFEKLQRTQALFRRACNLLVDIIREDTEKELRLWQRYNLHHAGYYRVREAVPELGAQLVCNAVRAVSAAYKTLLSKLKMCISAWAEISSFQIKGLHFRGEK